MSACGRDAPPTEVTPVDVRGSGSEGGGAGQGQQDSSAASCPHVAVVPKCRDGFCLIPSGCFIKGSPLDEPFRARYREEEHPVTLTQSFVMQDHETTQQEWAALGFKNLAGTRTNDDGGKDCTEPSCPASTMTWFEAVHFANEKSSREGLPACIELLDCTGTVGVDFECKGYRQTTSSYYECKGYRIPTMYEVEYAKRAGTRTAFYSGPFEPASNECIDIPHLDDTAWYCANSKRTTHPAKSKKPNPWGLYDMMGNASEFTSSDPYAYDPDIKPETDPEAQINTKGQIAHVDGAYFAWPTLLRSAAKTGELYYFMSNPQRTGMGVALGFRLVRSVSPEEAARW
ncbi:formylglycine-generating enzyme family protein [Labilithrix luteola]|uniref:formylglycine-generating enzyme family protein n=1 Tax=Labilithrix luteola TaxID=1391654 RepID=UPI0023DDC61E|nr:formylglycine-generating enzyme family protein [Labilithrix luteola]